MDLACCLEDLLRMLTPLPRLERTGSSVGCSPAPQRPSPSDRRVGSSEKLSGPAQGSRAFRPALLHLGCTEDFPGGFRRTISRLTCSARNRCQGLLGEPSQNPRRIGEGSLELAAQDAQNAPLSAEPSSGSRHPDTPQGLLG
jgi:hypothetical protein